MPNNLELLKDHIPVKRLYAHAFVAIVAGLIGGGILAAIPVIVFGADISRPVQSTLSVTTWEPGFDANTEQHETPSDDGQLNDSAVQSAAANDDAREQSELVHALLIPVSRTSFSQLRDTFSDARSHGRIHDAIDIMAPEGTPVLAAASGTIAHLARCARGGIAIYQFDLQKKHIYFYAHLRAYADGLSEGSQVQRGDVIAYVGHTGNAHANAPHLHFAVSKIESEKRWWGGAPINPYPLFKSINVASH